MQGGFGDAVEDYAELLMDLLSKLEWHSGGSVAGGHVGRHIGKIKLTVRKIRGLMHGTLVSR